MAELMDNIIACILGLKNINNINYWKNELELKNYFGFFISIKISKSKKLNEYPEDIYGCLGWWEKDYNIVEYEKFYNQIFDICKNIIKEDKRSKSFPFSLVQTSDTIIEFDLMKFPIIEILNNNIENNKDIIQNGIFNNDKYGLIIQSKNKTATYLPGVFKKNYWKEITKSISNKAGVSDFEIKESKFKVYKIDQFKKQIIEIINFDYLKQYLQTILDFLNNCCKLKDFPIPYEIKDFNNIINNQKELIRNLSVIDCIMKFEFFNKEEKIINIFESIMIYYSEYLKKKLLNKNIYDQEINEYLMTIFNNKRLISNNKNLLFLINILKSTKINYEKLISIKDEDFFLPQALIYITKTNQTTPKIIQLFYNDKLLNFLLNLQEINNENIFKINWNIQWIFQLINKNLVIFEINIFKILIKKMKEFYFLNKGLKNMETNVIVVYFEALSFLIVLLKIKNSFIEKLTNLNDIYLELFCYLLKFRYDKKNGFLIFRDKSIRLDITSHFLNSIHNFIIMS